MSDLQHILKYGCNILNATLGFIGQPIRDMFVIQYNYPEDSPIYKGMSINKENSLAYIAAMQHDTLIRYNFPLYLRDGNNKKLIASRYICIPILSSGSVATLGFMTIGSSCTEFTNKEISSLELLAKTVEQNIILNEKELSYNLAYNDAPIMSYIIDYNGYIIDVNNLWEKLLGYSKSEVVGKDIFDFKAGIHRNVYESLFEGFKKKGILRDFPLFYKKKNGETLEMRTSLTRFNLQDPYSKIYATCENVTQVNQLQRRFEYLLKYSSEMFVLSDLDAKFLRINNAFTHSLGYTLGDLEDFTIFDIVHPDDYSITYEAWSKLKISFSIINPPVTELENRCRCKDGSYRWLLWRISLSGQHNIVNNQVYAVILDIHQNRLLREELIQSRQMAVAASEAKSQFIATVSHELRTPLNSIIGFTNLLIEQGSSLDNSQNPTYLQRIFQNSLHLLNLIDSVLDISKIESGNYDIHYSNLCLNYLISDTINEVTRQAYEKNLDLILELPSIEVWWVSDISKLRQIIINLVVNAIKFTIEGSVTVRLNIEEGTLHPLSIEIIDTGIGIKQEDIPCLFNKFYQINRGYNRIHPGTGLGLYISRELARALDLDLTIESTFQEGSCFKIIFPSSRSSTLR